MKIKRRSKSQGKTCLCQDACANIRLLFLMACYLPYPPFRKDQCCAVIEILITATTWLPLLSRVSVSRIFWNITLYVCKMQITRIVVVCLVAFSSFSPSTRHQTYHCGHQHVCVSANMREQAYTRTRVRYVLACVYVCV